MVHTDDGGDLSLRGGSVEMTFGLETLAYLCLFGGNEDDSGRGDRSKEWWGNKLATTEHEKLRSETQYLMGGLPKVANSLRLLADAATRDLRVFKELGIADTIAVEVVPVDARALEFLVDVSANGIESRFSYIENWKAVE